jgi:hypothetical protein
MSTVRYKRLTPATDRQLRKACLKAVEVQMGNMVGRKAQWIKTSKKPVSDEFQSAFSTRQKGSYLCRELL